MKTSILLIGANGYVGKKLNAAFYHKGWTTHCPTRDTLMSELIHATAKYDYVVNAAGYTGRPNVDACKHNRQRVLQDNLLLPTLLTEWCLRHDTPLVHISSGCIYNGHKPDGSGFRESDEPNFSFLSRDYCSYYSGSKAAAETVVRRLPDHQILRLRMPFNGQVSDRNLLVKLCSYEKLVDVKNSITHIDDFVASTVMIMEEHLPCGTWNLVNDTPITTKDICKLLNKYGAKNKYAFFKNYDEFAATVEEPRSSCILSGEKAKFYGLPMRHTLVAMSEACQQIKRASKAAF